MDSIKKLRICLLVNVIILTGVICVVTLCSTGSEYFRFGWSESLIVVSVKVDTFGKYMMLLLFITIINISKVLVEELGMPVLGFSIYNPDKRVIEEFTKNQLQFYANSMFVVSGLRGIFMTIITITQIDIAIYSLLISEAASMYTIRLLLNEKEFPLDRNNNEYRNIQPIKLNEVIVENND